MNRRTAIVVGSASGSFVVAAAVGVAVALQGSGGAPVPRVTVAAAGATGADAAPSPSDAAAVSPSPEPAAPAPPGSCTIGESGQAVQVTLSAADAPTACTSLAQSLARSSGGFWQAEVEDTSLSLVCVVTNDGVSATVLDGGGEFLGHSLCSGLQGNGWVEDTAAESRILGAQRAAAAASAASASAAARQASDEQAASDALSSLQQVTDNLTGDVSSLKNDVGDTDKDLAAERNDAAQGPGDECVNASTTVYNDAATTIYNDEQTTLSNDIASAGRDVASSRSDVSALQRADAVLTTDGLSAPTGAADAIGAAQKAESDTIAAANADIDAVAADVATAYQIADGMATGACSDVSVPGTPPTPPTHLS